MASYVYQYESSHHNSFNSWVLLKEIKDKTNFNSNEILAIGVGSSL
jgi:hypothetical protein